MDLEWAYRWAALIGMTNLLAALLAYAWPGTAGIAIGLQISGLSLITVYWVFGSGPFFQRTVTSFGMSALMIASGLLILPVWLGRPAQLLFLVPAVVCMAQVPAWLVRIVWRWRLVQAPDRAEPALSITDMLVGMLVISLLLLGTTAFLNFAQLTAWESIELLGLLSLASLAAGGLVQLPLTLAGLLPGLRAKERLWVYLGVQIPALALAFLDSTQLRPTLSPFFWAAGIWAAGMGQDDSNPSSASTKKCHLGYHRPATS